MLNHLIPTLNLQHARLLLAGGVFFGSSVAQGDVVYQQDFENNWSNADGHWSTNTSASLGGPYTSVLGRFSATTVGLNVYATSENNGGYGGQPGSNPFNITVDQFDNRRQYSPFPDGGGGGGGGDPYSTDVPTINVGQTIQDQNSGSGPAMFGAGTYAVHFDLMLFDSWDGGWATHGTDSFAVAVNGEMLFDEFLYSSGYGAGLNFREPDETPSENAYDSRWADSIYRDIVLLFELTEETDRLSVDFIGRPSQSILDESWGLDNVRIEQVSSARSMSVPEVPGPGTLALLGSGFGLMIRRKR